MPYNIVHHLRARRSIIGVCLGVSTCFFLFIYFYFIHQYPLPKPLSIHSSSADIASSNDTDNIIQIPKIIHQMWKDSYNTIPNDLKRWRNGCIDVNNNYEFKLYYDDELKIFVKDYYPEYLDLFNSLHGVYMADMARILLVYHYGGIYMDLDFYCVRPFDCMMRNIEKKYDLSVLQSPSSQQHTSPFKTSSSLQNQPARIHIDSAIESTYIDKNDGVGYHLLVVPNEPLLHSVMFHLKPRTVTQDFFAATPHHPFFKWMLDERNTYFHALKNHQPMPNHYLPFSHSVSSSSSSSSNIGSNIQSSNNKNNLTIASATIINTAISRSTPTTTPITLSPTELLQFELPSHISPYRYDPKGPFSYQFDKDLDRYYYYMCTYFSIRNNRVEMTQSKSKTVVSSSTTAGMITSVLINKLQKAIPTADTATTADNNVNDKRFLTSSYIHNDNNNNQQQHHHHHHHHNHHDSNNNINFNKQFGYVIELSESALHPLIDTTNSKLYSTCDTYYSMLNHDNNNQNHNNNNNHIDTSILTKDERNKVNVINAIHKFQLDTSVVDLKSLCKQVKEQQFFNYKNDASSSIKSINDGVYNTIAVHMWSHVYLGWNFIRSFLNSQMYRHVERTLPATLSCCCSTKT